MKLLASILLCSGAALGQVLSVGLKAGVPLTESFSAPTQPTPLNYRYDLAPRRYVVGGTAEVHIPFGLAVELDALYKRLGYNASFNSMAILFSSEATVANQWEFPLLLKYRFHGLGPLRPFIDVGPSLRHLSGLEQTITQTYLPTRTLLSTTKGTPVELQSRNSPGIAVGGGLEFHLLFIHVMPEVRYTHWTDTAFRGIYERQGFSLNNDQADFVLGLTF